MLIINNFLVAESNKPTIVASGAVDPLVTLLSAKDLEIQCNTCGCVTTLASSGKADIELSLRCVLESQGAFINKSRRK